VNNGGAIESGWYDGTGTVTVTSSTFSGDSSEDGDGGAIESGGHSEGVSGALGSGMLTVTKSTFSGDSAVNGGAIASGDDGGNGTLTAAKSTFSDDDSVNDGGAIDIGDGGSGTASIVSSTFDGNGGNATINNANGSVTVAGSIVADSSGSNCSGTITDAGFNLEDDTGASCGFSATEHDLVGVNPQLGTLGDNGGPTQTLEPDPTSPVLDQIPNPTTVTIGSNTFTLCPGKDQRGGGAPPPRYGCAIGSVDLANTTLPLVTSLTPSSGSAAGGNKVTIRGANFTAGSTVQFGTATLDPTSVTFDSASQIVVTAPAGTAGTVDVTVTTSQGTSPFRPTDEYTYT
jgi:hypothetical protein